MNVSLLDRLERIRSGSSKSSKGTGGSRNREDPGTTTEPRGREEKAELEGPEDRAEESSGRLDSIGAFGIDPELWRGKSELLGRLSRRPAVQYPPRRKKREDPLEPLKERIHNRLVREVERDLLERINEPDERAKLREKVESVVSEVLEEEEALLLPAEREALLQEILNDVMGYGPINSLIQDPTITEIMVNGPYQVYIERNGKLELTDATFRDANHVMHVIERIVAPLGRRIDEASPMVDARLPDGSRVNAIIPPLSLVGPCITIRKFLKDLLTVEDLVYLGTLTWKMARFLEACVNARLNIVVSGGTGSGKTTTLNVLSSFIPEDERIITIEDAAELQLRQQHVVRLESRPPNIEGKGAVTIRDLVRNALRMRPNRIVVGEVRGGEALDMLQAMNTGHDGSLTTVHANSPRDALSRLETMTLMSGMDLPVRAIREQIASAVDLIVHQERLRDGTRKIVRITEVQGMEGEVVTTQDIFLFEQLGVDERGRVAGEFRATGIRPRSADRFEAHGIHLPPDIFD
ncbi:MAG TPA: CpaF family protein [Firmicutes bacterium]|nr:CpaF family protein [Bacillota bacterium]